MPEKHPRAYRHLEGMLLNGTVLFTEREARSVRQCRWQGESLGGCRSAAKLFSTR